MLTIFKKQRLRVFIEDNINRRDLFTNEQCFEFDRSPLVELPIRDLLYQMAVTFPPVLQSLESQ